MPEQGVAQIRYDLRYGMDSGLDRRRGIVGLSLFSVTILSGIALFQVGVLKRLPDPPFPGFDADRVNASKEAYSHFATPDALLAIASYGFTACLAGMGGLNRPRWMRFGMCAKVTLDTVMAGILSIRQWTRFRTFSIWSLMVSGATFTSFGLALPEIKRAVSGDS